MERTIKNLTDYVLYEPKVLENDRLREAISVVVQELTLILKAKQYEHTQEDDKCPCGCDSSP